jgi:hypothetical protein
MTMVNSGGIGLAHDTTGAYSDTSGSNSVSVEHELNATGAGYNSASTAQISLNDTAVRQMAGVSSGQIALSNLYSKNWSQAYSYSGTTTNVDFRTYVVNQGWDQNRPVILVNNGTIGSTSTGSYAMTISGSFPNGATFINYGYVVGAGGAGGSSEWLIAKGYSQFSATGGNGGPAIYVSTGVTIYNYGIIGGGGGGGGSAIIGDFGYWQLAESVGGGGAGYYGGDRGHNFYEYPGGFYSYSVAYYTPNSTAGATYAAGSAEIGVTAYGYGDAWGGYGGYLGSVGATGYGDGRGSGYVGGLGGTTVNGNSHVTWASKGSIYGTLTG